MALGWERGGRGGEEVGLQGSCWAAAGTQKVEGPRGGSQDASAQTSGPFESREETQGASCSVLPPPGSLPAAGPSPPVPLISCFLWALCRASAAALGQAAEAEEALLPASWAVCVDT